MSDTGHPVPIRVPRINVNDDTVILVKWLAEPGQWVETGSDLFLVETSKAATPIQAEGDGVLLPSSEVGREVRVSEVIGHLMPRLDGPQPSPGPAASDVRPPSTSATLSKPRAEGLAPPVGTEQVRITKAAEVLARQLGIDPAAIPHRGVIRETDVRDHHARLGAEIDTAQVPPVPSAPPVSTAGSDGAIHPDLLEHIAGDREAFGRLGSDFKIWLYRQHGAVIGRGVTLGAGTVLEANRIVIGDDTSLAKGVVVRCREFVMGRLGEIGDNAKVLGGGFFAGNVVGIRFNAVFVGFNAARNCHIGDNSFIAYDTYINTDMDVTIGRHVCLAPAARIYTHRKWLSPLEGYSVGFAPVVIGDDTHLGSGVVVLPGVTVGARVTIMANSVVATNTGDERLLAGIPAQPVGHQLAYRRQLDDAAKRNVVLTALRTALETLAHDGVTVAWAREESDGLAAELHRRGATMQVVFRPDLAGWPPPVGRTCLLSFDRDALSRASREMTVFDLHQQRVAGGRDPLADLFRTHLSHHGLEFEPSLWREGKTGPGNPDRFDFDAPGANPC